MFSRKSKEQLRKKPEKSFKETINGSSPDYDCNGRICEIEEYIKNLLNSQKRDEIFYKNIVEKIVVHSRERMDVYLNVSPECNCLHTAL